MSKLQALWDKQKTFCDPETLIEGATQYDWNGDEQEVETVQLEYEKVLRVTDKAALFKMHGEDVWVPKSQIYDATERTIDVSEWFANKEDLS